MDFTPYVKKLRMPDGFTLPVRLVHHDVVATPLTRADLAEDLHAIRMSVDLIRRTRGGKWPPEELGEVEDLDDLVWHEVEWSAGISFAYVVRDAAGTYLGCFYLYPLGRRAALSEEVLGFDVDVSWWVSSSAYDSGYYARLYDALRAWLANAFPFWKPYFSNREIPG